MTGEVGLDQQPGPDRFAVKLGLAGQYARLPR